MASHLTTPALAQCLLLFLPLLLLLLRIASRYLSGNDKQRRQPKRLPPSPPGLPVVGHLHLVGDLPHISLRDLAAKNNRGDGLMLLRLGTIPHLIVSTPRTAQAVLRMHDHVFASRPPSIVVDNLQYGPSSSFSAAPYGEPWRQVRKLVTTHLLTVKKVNSYHLARQEEVRLVLDKLRQAAAVREEVDISEMVNTLTNDIVCHAVSGKFFRAEGRNKLFRELIEVNSTLSVGFILENYFPGLGFFLGMFTRFVRNKAADAHKRWDELLENIICDHERRRFKHSGEYAEQEQSADFIDVMLSLQQEYGITRDSIKVILMDIFGAGTDTSALVLEFAMVELMRNPEIRIKLQDEVRKKTPKGQEIVNEDNLASMTYMRAVVKETLRLHPPAPLLLPHQSMEDCVLMATQSPLELGLSSTHGQSTEIPSHGRRLMNSYQRGSLIVAALSTLILRGITFSSYHLELGEGCALASTLGWLLLRSCWRTSCTVLTGNSIMLFWNKDDIDMTEVFGLTVHRKDKLFLVPKQHDNVPQAM